jgi:hypothetical protein
MFGLLYAFRRKHFLVVDAPSHPVVLRSHTEHPDFRHPKSAGGAVVAAVVYGR